MRTRLDKGRGWEWVLGGAMVVLCVGLSALQYRWTGEMARSEAARMKGNLTEQVQALVREFESELSTSCDQLRPERGEFSGADIEKVHSARYREWKAASNRPLFGRIALGMVDSTSSGVLLKMMDLSSGEFGASSASWPVEWAWMRESLDGRMRGGRPPAVDRQGMLLEFPVFRNVGNEHWLILQLDLEYLKTRWLPELVEKHLNPNGAILNDVRIAMEGGEMLYATGDAKPTSGVVSSRLNRAGRTERRSNMPMQSNGAWVLEAWARPGALEALVERSQRRNLAVALCLNFLMLCTGFALIRYAGKARELADRQMHFVATVSHELRTPLTAIRGAGQNLLRGVVKNPEDVQEYHRLILRHADHLKEMAEQTLALAGAGRGTENERSPVDVVALVKESLSAASEELKAHGCESAFSFEDNLPPVLGDSGALRRVFQNLMVNAAKHGGGGGWVGVMVAKGKLKGRSSDAVMVKVSDRGAGISATELGRIFEPFYRGSLARDKQVRGSGLGLSVVRAIVEEHGGEVEVTSREGEGSVFEVRLPACA